MAIIATIEGFLGADAELKSTTAGAVVNLNIGSQNWKKKGQEKADTSWVRVALFNDLAQVAKDYQKGWKVEVTTKNLTLKEFEDKTGQKRSGLECIADTVRYIPKTDAHPAAEKAKPTFKNMESAF